MSVHALQSLYRSASYFREPELYLKRIDRLFDQIKYFFEKDQTSEERLREVKEEILPAVRALLYEKIYSSEEVMIVKNLLNKVGEDVESLLEKNLLEDEDSILSFFSAYKTGLFFELLDSYWGAILGGSSKESQLLEYGQTLSAFHLQMKEISLDDIYGSEETRLKTIEKIMPYLRALKGLNAEVDAEFEFIEGLMAATRDVSAATIISHLERL